MMGMTRFQTARLFFAATALATLTAACAPQTDVRGNLPPVERLAQIKPGKMNRDDVATLLGSPASTGAWDDETWYYVQSKVETTAFYKPEEVERTVIAVQFDRTGVVDNVKKLGLGDGKDIELVSRTTPTAGNEMGLLEQLLGNLGRFNNGGGSGHSVGGRPPGL